MGKYIIKRILMMIPVLIGVSILVFLIQAFTPGDPADLVLGAQQSEETKYIWREKYDLNDNIVVQYGKYMYEMKRREKQAKKQARANATELKCLQMHLTTDTADYERMVEQAKSFLDEGDKVKLSLRFRGRRELSNMNYAKELMKGLLSRFDGLAVLDSPPALNGKELSCIIRKA